MPSTMEFPLRIVRKLGNLMKKTGEKGLVAIKLKELTGAKINSKQYKFLYEAIDFLQALKELGAVFFVTDQSFIVQINQLKFNIETWEELFIMNEIFVDGIYDVSLKGNFSLIDIGMNVGMASLYFACKENCEYVFAYEPFRETIKYARINMSLNDCSKKIHIQDVGLGYPERTVSVPYVNESKGVAGILGKTGLGAAHEQKFLRQFHISDVSGFVSKNLEQYPGTFVAKIDCEGAEYEIIDRLNQVGMLTKIDFYMIEWHFRGSEALETIFTNNEYYVMCRPNNNGTGIMYAAKSPRTGQPFSRKTLEHNP